MRLYNSMHVDYKWTLFLHKWEYIRVMWIIHYVHLSALYIAQIILTHCIHVWQSRVEIDSINRVSFFFATEINASGLCLLHSRLPVP